MRARRVFQPTIELMPLRLAPSDTGIQINPMDPVSSTPTTGPAMMNPMLPTSMPTSGPSSGSAPIQDAGSSVPGFGRRPAQLC